MVCYHGYSDPLLQTGHCRSDLVEKRMLYELTMKQMGPDVKGLSFPWEESGRLLGSTYVVEIIEKKWW